MAAVSRAERQRRADLFRRRCREAIENASHGCGEAEQRRAAEYLGEAHRLPDPQDELPLEECRAP